MNTTRENAPTFEQNQEFNAAVLKALPRLSRFQQQTWIGDMGLLRKALADALIKHSPSTDDQLSFWLAFYRNRFPQQFEAAGGEKAFRSIRIPEERKGFGWLVVVLKGITTQQVYAICEALFQCDKAAGTDFNVLKNARVPENSYAIWVRDSQEVVDEDLYDLSASAVRIAGYKTMTLLERMLLELRYFTETGGHLDRTSTTLCAGSSFLPNCTPHATNRHSLFFIGWSVSDYTSSANAAREVVG